VTAGRTLLTEVQNSEPGTRNSEPKTASNARALFAALERYLRAKAEFVDYMKRLEQTQPLAIYSGNLDDFLCMDPAYDAALTVLESGTVLIPGQSPAVGDAAVQDAISRWRDGLADAAHERLRSPSFEGEVTPGLRIAGLQYRADITAGWDSRVEPAENVVAAVHLAAVDRAGAELFLDAEELVVLATRSVRQSEPVLIWPALVATAMSAMVTSSVSPERCEMTAV
jgi:hypothetical protein